MRKSLKKKFEIVRDRISFYVIDSLNIIDKLSFIRVLMFLENYAEFNLHEVIDEFIDFELEKVLKINITKEYHIKDPSILGYSQIIRQILWTIFNFVQREIIIYSEIKQQRIAKIRTSLINVSGMEQANIEIFLNHINFPRKSRNNPILNKSLRVIEKELAEMLNLPENLLNSIGGHVVCTMHEKGGTKISLQIPRNFQEFIIFNDD